MATGTKEVTGWKWTNRADFITAQNACNTALGISAGGDDTTSNSMAEKTNDFGGSEFWYCGEHPQLIATLGAPITFIINIEIAELIE